MKKLILLFLLFPQVIIYAQVPAYYSSIDFSQMGLELKDDLSDLITSTHTSPTSYSEVWDVLKQADLDPTNSSVVLLIYGYNDDDGSVINDRTRDKNANGGSPGEWNREHVFPKSLGAPDLGTSGPGSDPHNLRASDVQNNGNRSNRKYADGSGNSGTVGSNWYPGDEWKGDAARIIMYMYLRYGNRCLPSAVAVGSTNAIDGNMIDLLLEWNAEDDVSEHEINRNNAIFEAIGNRNPFIDNPHIATHIWGGIEATDTWGNLNLEEETNTINFNIYPNPVIDDRVYISTSTSVEIVNIAVIDLQGKEIMSIVPAQTMSTYSVALSHLPTGIFFIRIETITGVEVRKIILQ